MIFSVSLAGWLIAGALASAQTGTAPAAGQNWAPPPEFINAAQAFGQCLGDGASKLPGTVTPEDGARQVVAGSAARKAAMEARFEAWITGPGFREEGRAPAREARQKEMAGVEPQLAAGVRKSRGTK